MMTHASITTAESNQPSPKRRDFLFQAGTGLGAIALQSLLLQDPVFRTNRIHASYSDTHSPSTGPAHLKPRAKNIIYLFMDGGPSHLDTFDPKPLINKYAGNPLPDSIERVITPMGVSNNSILPSQRKWKYCGKSGIPVSDWYPHVGECADDLCVIRSCWANGLNHVGSVSQMNTGSILGGRPSLGAWVSYGLGTENQSLPSFVVLLDNAKEPPGGSRVWGTGFMPAQFQGTRFRNGETPILHLSPPSSVSVNQQRNKLDFINKLNEQHRQRRRINQQLKARIEAYELAFRMQTHAPEAIDLSQETQSTLEMYGIHSPQTAAFGKNCLLARRLVERGVRFVQLYSGSGSKWDAHSAIEKNHSDRCGETDLPIAGLLKDLKRRGLLEETLVIWGGEFGRTPMSEKGDGRDHNPYGFTIWMAGGGTRGGRIVGETDDFGLHAIQNRAHVHDIHATILHLAGLNHEQLVFQRQGRPERATVNEGRVIKEVFS